MSRGHLGVCHRFRSTSPTLTATLRRMYAAKPPARAVSHVTALQVVMPHPGGARARRRRFAASRHGT